MRMNIDRFKACALVGWLLVSMSGAACGAPDDWPQFRGPTDDDISPDTGLLKEWPAEGPPLAWKAAGLGKGYSSVAVVGDTLSLASSSK